MIVNANSVVQHVIQLKNGIMIIVNVSVKSIVSVGNWNIAHVIVKMVNI